MTKVVNLNKESYDIYIGRGSKWGNPFTHIKDRETLAEYVVDTREEAIENYREYLLNNDELMNSLDELIGKKLGCFCSPKRCHGDIIVEVITQMKLKKFLNNGN